MISDVYLKETEPECLLLKIHQVLSNAVAKSCCQSSTIWPSNMIMMLLNQVTGKKREDDVIPYKNKWLARVEKMLFKKKNNNTIPQF